MYISAKYEVFGSNSIQYIVICFVLYIWLLTLRQGQLYLNKAVPLEALYISTKCVSQVEPNIYYEDKNTQQNNVIVLS